VKRRGWTVLAVLAVAGAAIAALALSAARPVTDEGATPRLGIERAAPERAGAEATHLVRRSVASATAAFGPQVGTGTFDGISPAVSSLPVLPVPTPTSLSARDNEMLGAAQGSSSNANDPVVQHAHGTSGSLTDPIQNFDGICLPFGPPCGLPSGCGCLPPDPNGAVGLTQYVQMVNTDFAVFDKSTGAILRTATPINQLWSAVGGECAAHNDGDPVVVYDQFANRWLLSQFIATPSGSEQYGECIAVSQTGDATGAYYLYTFLFGSNVFFDYPKIGVWRDAYYMSANEFPSDTVTSAGAGAFAFERSAMLNGQAPRYVFFDESTVNPIGGQYIGQLPGTADGLKPPPAGEPDVFAEVDDPTGIPPNPPDAGFDLRLWKFHVDWTNPQASTFGNNGAPSSTIPVAPFVRAQCTYGYGDCAPQEGGAQGLDVLGDRLMFRLVYRNFGDHESLVFNHTVKVGTRDGIRWYEVRNPTGTPTIYQQGTYAPDDSTTDPLWRWMGSVAMDKRGDIAIGYSASGPNEYPSLRYTGRAPNDPLGQMTQAEHTVFTGTGPQTEVEGRWGDYSALTVDPSDDCTFWYTNEYLASDALVIGTWRTRVASFKFTGCK
jgi:hypothetical protein